MNTFRASLAALVLAAFAPLAHACSVPVFRYALERWPADNWQLVVPASNEAKWTAALSGRSLNLEVFPRKASSTATDARLSAPEHEAPDTSWSLAAPEDLAALTDAPFLKETVRRILAGDSAVFVVVGPPKAAEAAADKLTKRLRYLESVLSLPELNAGDPEDNVNSGVPLRLKFSHLVVTPDTAPRAVEQLTKIARAATTLPGEYANAEVFIYPVFGRGRVLSALPVTEDLDAMLDEICTFLVGACSCQVKRLNPGADLLLNLDWEAELARLAQHAEAAASADAKPAPAAAKPATDSGRFTGDTGAPETVTIEPNAPNK